MLQDYQVETGTPNVHPVRTHIALDPTRNSAALKWI